MHTFEIFSLFLGGYLLCGGSSILLSGRLSVSFPSPLFSLIVKFFKKELCPPLKFSLCFWVDNGYPLIGGRYLLLSGCLSTTCPSPLFSLLAKFFLQMVPTYEIFLFLFQSGYPLSGGSSPPIPGCLSASCPSPLFSLLAKSFKDGAHL
jgi:hypothetical protein